MPQVFEQSMFLFSQVAVGIEPYRSESMRKKPSLLEQHVEKGSQVSKTATFMLLLFVS